MPENQIFENLTVRRSNLVLLSLVILVTPVGIDLREWLRQDLGWSPGPGLYLLLGYFGYRLADFYKKKASQLSSSLSASAERVFGIA